MNPLQHILGGQVPNAQPMQQQMPMGQSGMRFQNPMQKMQFMMQAMRNPAAFVKNVFPDIPDNIMNDGNQVLNYLKQSRGITDQDIRNVQSQMPYPGY